MLLYFDLQKHIPGCLTISATKGGLVSLTRSKTVLVPQKN